MLTGRCFLILLSLYQAIASGEAALRTPAVAGSPWAAGARAELQPLGGGF